MARTKGDALRGRSVAWHVAAAATACVAMATGAVGIAAGQVEVKELSLDVQGDGERATLQRFRLGGDAEVAGGMIRLTADAQGKAGWIWSRSPTPARMEDEWTMEVDVQLHGSSSSMSGDGMALWLTPRPLDGDAEPVGTGQSLGPNFGMPSRFAGLGVFLDTFDNAPGRHSRRFPHVAGVFHRVEGRGTEYAHNTPEFAHAMDSAQACSEAIRSSDARGPGGVRTTTVRLEYEGPPAGAAAGDTSGILAVSLLVSSGRRLSDDSPSSAWRQCFVLRGISLPAGLFLGASASTGDLTDAHEIDRVRVYAPAKGREPVRAAPSPSPQVAAMPAAAEAAPRAAGREGPFCDASSEEEVDAIVAGTAAMVGVNSTLAGLGEGLARAESRLRERLRSGLERVESALRRLERSREELDAKHAALAERAAEVEATAAALAARRGGWWEAGVIAVVLILAGASAFAVHAGCAARDRLDKAHSL